MQDHEKLLSAVKINGQDVIMESSDFITARDGEHEVRVGFSLQGIKKLIPIVRPMYSKERPSFIDESAMDEFQKGALKRQFEEKWVRSKDSFVKSTELINFRESVAFAREAYVSHGYQVQPKLFTISDSPVSCGMVHQICQHREVLEYLGCGSLWGLLDRNTFKPDDTYFDTLICWNEERENKRVKAKFVSPTSDPEMYNRIWRSAIESVMVAATGKVNRDILENAAILGPVGVLAKKFDTLRDIKATMYDGCEGDKSWWENKYAAKMRYSESDVSDVRRDIQNAINLQAYGNCDSECAAYWDWHMQIGCENAEKYFPLVGMAMTAGWWHASEITCHLQNRPWSIGFDAAMQNLHNVTGPALAYRDGYTYWSIENQKVDEQLVMCPETQTLDQIERETNADLKTIRISRWGGVDEEGDGKAGLGWARYARESGMKVVDKWINPMTAYEEALLVPDGDDNVQVLLAVCPTKRPFGVPVPKIDANGVRVNTCEQAQRWTAPEPGLNIIGRT